MSDFQRGFAPIALVVLLLFGIAAGTLLVQQGTNLLPQASEQSDCIETCDFNFTESNNKCQSDYSQCVNRSDEISVCATLRNDCRNEARDTLNNCTSSCRSNAEPTKCSMVLYGQTIKTNLGEYYEGDCVPSRAKRVAKYCNSNGEFSAWTTIDDPTCNTAPTRETIRSILATTCAFVGAKDGLLSCKTSVTWRVNDLGDIFLNIMLSGGSIFTDVSSGTDTSKLEVPTSGTKELIIKYLKNDGSTKISLNKNTDEVASAVINLPDGAGQQAPAAAAPAPAAPQGGPAAKTVAPVAPAPAAPAAAQAVTGGCDPKYNQTECIDKGKTRGCYQDSKGNPICLLGGSQCSDGTSKNCTEVQKLNGCKVVGGEERCLYSQDGPCNAKDEAFCPGKCRVITREGSKYSECQQECTDGWWNYCYINYQKGCKKDDKGVPMCDGAANPKNISRAAAAAAPAAAVPAAARAPGGPSVGSPGSVNTNCGTDANGIQIPCFKIGVFDEATLQATIADAKIASLNYDLYTRIITDLKQYVNTSQAEAKTAAAKQAANQCINNTKP